MCGSGVRRHGCVYLPARDGMCQGHEGIAQYCVGHKNFYFFTHLYACVYRLMCLHIGVFTYAHVRKRAYTYAYLHITHPLHILSMPHYNVSLCCVQSLIFLAAARLSAYFDYPLYVLLFLSKVLHA